MGSTNPYLHGKLDGKQIGSFISDVTNVAEGLGGNKKADMADRINVLNIPKLFMDGSPHSSYVCQDYKKNGARCGVNFQY